MHGALTGKRIRAQAEAAHQATLHRPDARLHVGMKAPREVVHHATVSAQHIVFRQRLKNGGHQPPLRRNAGRTFQFLLDAVRNRNFVGEQLEAGHLLVGLLDHLL